MSTFRSTFRLAAFALSAWTFPAVAQPPAPPALSMFFSPSSVVLHETSTLTFTVTVPEVLFGVTFTDTLPAGLVVSTPNGLTGSCDRGVISAAAGGSIIALSGAILQPRTPCSFSVNVTASALGVQQNNVTVGDEPSGAIGNTASASLDVVDLLSKSFGAATINTNGVTSLRFVLFNPSLVALTGINVTDLLPAGLTVLAGTSVVNTCGGSVGIDVSGLVSLERGVLQSKSSCVLSMNVVGTSPGVKTSQTSVPTTAQGVNGGPATASVTVLPVKEPVLPPALTQKFGTASVSINATTRLIFTLANPNPYYQLTGVGLTDVLPTGLVIASPAGLTSDCGAGIIAPGGSTNISISDVSLPHDNSCSIALNVTGSAAGLLTNTTSVVSASESGPGQPATAFITVINASIPVLAPLLTQAFGTNVLNQDDSTTLTFTLINPNVLTVLNGIGFTDMLPAGLAISTPDGLVDNCGGVVVAASGTRTISLSHLTLAPSTTCTIIIKVKGLTEGLQTNTTSEIVSVEGGTGLAATAMVTVSAIIDSDAVQVTYASNMTIGDSIINITNTGALTLPGRLEVSGNICVNIYTFDASEELITCCSCLATPNGLYSVSPQPFLFSLTPAVPTSLVIFLVATTPIGLSPLGQGGTCNPSSPVTTAAAPGVFGSLVPGMRAWATTLHSLPTTPVTYGVTERELVNAPISFAQLRKFALFCGFIQANGSGFGICKSCRTGGQAGASK